MENINIETVTNDTVTNDTVATGAATIETNTNTAEQQEVKTFTQEELNSILQKRLQRQEKELRTKLEAEFNSKLNTGIQDGISEAEKLSKMTETQKKEYELEKKLNELAQKERDYQTRELKATAKGMLADLGYGTESVSALESLINYTDADTTKASIDNLHNVLNAVVDQRVAAEINSRLKTETKPVATVSRGGSYTWDDVLNGTCTLAEYKKHKNS